MTRKATETELIREVRDRIREADILINNRPLKADIMNIRESMKDTSDMISKFYQGKLYSDKLRWTRSQVKE